MSDETGSTGRGPSASGDHLAAVFEALQLSEGLHELRPPADETSLLAVEARLGRELPAGLKRLYAMADGFHLFLGNLNIVPAGPGTFTLLDHSEMLRNAGAPIPQELLVLGNFGGDESFGLWYPPAASPDDPTPVVEIGEIAGPDCMAIDGTDLPVFLLGWCAYYLALYEAPREALEAIGLPAELWDHERTSSSAAYLAWADPALPRPDPDPYLDRLDVAAVRAFLERPARD